MPCFCYNTCNVLGFFLKYKKYVLIIVASTPMEELRMLNV